MCPPLIGSIGDIKVKLASYNKAILIRYMEEIDVKLDKKQIKRSKINFTKNWRGTTLNNRRTVRI